MEEKFIAAINNPAKLFKAPVNEISGVLRYCMLKVGMRANNLPNEIESQILYQHLIEYYGKLSVEEIRLAFDLAVTGKIEAPETYENFSCAYLSKVLNAYKDWAGHVYDSHRIEIEKPKEPVPVRKLNELNTWRESVQKALDNFYIGKNHWRLWPTEMYDQLVYDDFIPALCYKDFIAEERRLFCEQLHNKIIQVESILEKDKSKLSFHKDLQNQLIEYRNGTRDKEVILVSKQKAMLYYFKYLESKDIKKIYVQ